MVIVAVTLIGAACGSSADDPEVAAVEGSDDNTAVTVAGADSGIEEEGDARPDDAGPESPAVVIVTVDVPDEMDRAGLAIVALEDVTLSDVESVEIGRVELPVADLVAQDNTVEVFLPLPLDGTIDVTATVHIDIDESGSLSPGDWISNELAPVTPETASTITVGIVRI